MKLKVDNPLIPHPSQDPEVLLYESKAKEFRKMLQESTTPEQIKEWLLRVCEAEDVKMDHDGNMYKTPNWNARIQGLDRVMDILRIHPNKAIQPTITEHKGGGTIIIQVVGGEKEPPKQIIEAKEEK